MYEIINKGNFSNNSLIPRKMGKKAKKDALAKSPYYANTHLEHCKFTVQKNKRMCNFKLCYCIPFKHPKLTAIDECQSISMSISAETTSKGKEASRMKCVHVIFALCHQQYGQI